MEKNMYICINKPLHCTPEINTLNINYTPIKKKKLVFKYLISNTLVSVNKQQEKIGCTN